MKEKEFPKIQFADYNEHDVHRDAETGLINFKELELCRYLEHMQRKEER